MKMMGTWILAFASSFCKSSPLSPGSRTSSTRQLGTAGSCIRKSSTAELNTWTSRSIDSNRLTSAKRTPSSSSTMKTVGFWPVALPGGKVVGLGKRGLRKDQSWLKSHLRTLPQSHAIASDRGIVAHSVRISVVPLSRAYLAPENAVADEHVKQHEREDEQSFAPEHESKGGMGSGALIDRDRERDHVGPE